MTDPEKAEAGEKAAIPAELIQKCHKLINERNKQNQLTEEIVRYILNTEHIKTTMQDIKEEIWFYENGIYKPNGVWHIKNICRDILEQFYTGQRANQVIEKIKADTLVDAKSFFGANIKDEIPVQNGILLLKEKRLISFDPEKIFFTRVPVEFNPTAKCPKIDKFLRDVLANAEDIKVVEEHAGYTLYKDNFLECATMFRGEGRNGKGKTISLFGAFCGEENKCNISLQELSNENSFCHAELFGKLINLAGDISDEPIKDTAPFKKITGRDMLGANRKFLNKNYFTPYAKHIFACNILPMVYDTTLGFWSRWLVLDFPFTFVTQEELDAVPETERNKYKLKDPQIIDKITTPEELSGFLNRALKGLQRLLTNKKFSTTKGTAQVKDAWIRKSNSCLAFCLDHIKPDPSSKTAYIKKDEFAKKYVEYCREHKVKRVSDKAISFVLTSADFGAVSKQMDIFEINETGIEKFKERAYVWDGIIWKNEEIW